MYRMKKTKIVATMSDFRCTEEFVKNLYDAGMDVVRVNSAHVRRTEPRISSRPYTG